MASRIARFLRAVVFGAATAVVATSAQAGPIIIGGDDLNDHGSFSGGVNLLGWLYIQNALASILPQVTRPGNDGTIVVLGSSQITPPAGASGDSCGAALYPAQVLGRTVTCIDTAANITTFFAQLAAGTVNPAVIVYPGDGAANGIDGSEEAAITANSAAISSFVASGGGLLAHTGPQGFATTLLPGLVLTFTCDATTATLTAAGQAAFPTVTNTDIRAGPCHHSFSGNFGGLQVLAIDTGGLPFILGGGGGTTFTPGPPAEIPTMSEWAMLLMGLMLATIAALRLRKH